MDEYTDGIVEVAEPSSAILVWSTTVAVIFLVIIIVVFLS